MHNQNGPVLAIDVAAVGYNPLALAIAQRAKYPRHVVDESINYHKDFEPHFRYCMLTAQLRAGVWRNG